MRIQPSTRGLRRETKSLPPKKPPAPTRRSESETKSPRHGDHLCGGGRFGWLRRGATQAASEPSSNVPGHDRVVNIPADIGVAARHRDQSAGTGW